MIKKGKSNKTNKLIVAQMIVADLKLLMRTCLGITIEESYENDKIIAKYSCGSRNGC